MSLEQQEVDQAGDHDDNGEPAEGEKEFDHHALLEKVLNEVPHALRIPPLERVNQHTTRAFRDAFNQDETRTRHGGLGRVQQTLTSGLANTQNPPPMNAPPTDTSPTGFAVATASSGAWYWFFHR